MRSSVSEIRRTYVTASIPSGCADMLMIIDINALADDTHRLGFIQREIPDWQAFYRPELIEKDTVFPGAAKALELAIGHFYTPIFIGGRPESTRGATTRWLADKL